MKNPRLEKQGAFQMSAFTNTVASTVNAISVPDHATKINLQGLAFPRSAQKLKSEVGDG